MAIILEGFDNSGKSTLADSFGLEVLHPGPRPKTAGDIISCIRAQLHRATDPVVMDRVTCISHPAYSMDRPFHRQYRGDALYLLGKAHCVLIYCRPSIDVILNFDDHVRKEYDTDRSLAELRRNARKVVANYDAIMHHLPHRVYDWTDPDRQLVQDAYDAQFSPEAWARWLDKTKR